MKESQVYISTIKYMIMVNGKTFLIMQKILLKTKMVEHMKQFLSVNKFATITFLASHFDRIKRLFGSGAFDSGCLASSHLNQST